MDKEIHVCPVCEYVHEHNSDEKWEDLPDSFICPACSVEKGWFETKFE